VFDFETSPVRVVDREGNPWFVLADVCRALEIANVGVAAARLDDDERNSICNTDVNRGRGNPNLVVINESGLYSLILTSRKDSAKRFKRWVTGTVLPSIRKHGGYVGTDRV
jgi:anti-repressor protein